MRLSIQKKYRYGIIMIALIPLLIMPMLSYWHSVDVISKKVINLSLQETKRYAHEFENLMDNIITGTNSFTFDEEIQFYIEQGIDAAETPLDVTKQIEKKIHYIQTTNWYVYDVETIVGDRSKNLYSVNSYDLSVRQAILNSKGYEEVAKGDEHFVWSNRLSGAYEKNENLVLFRSIKDSFYNKIGVIGVIVKPQTNQRVVSIDTIDNATDHLFILDTHGQMVFNDRLNPTQKSDYIFNQMQGKETAMIDLNGHKSIVTKSSIKLTGWTLYHVQNWDVVAWDLQYYRNWNIVINLVIFMMIIMASEVASRFITKAIVELSATMSKVAKGDLKARANIVGSEETTELSNDFNMMIDRIEALIAQVEKESAAKQMKHFEALQAQISPHFLLNTLNGIKWLIVMEDKEKAEGMILALGNLLERTLGKDRSIISLQEEIECLKNYCDIQTYRYGETFKVTFEVDETLNYVQVPALLLQPVVENCILHAFNETSEQGSIRVRTYRCEQHICLEVEDNGAGFKEKSLSTSNGIGMKNVEGRLGLYYDETCKVEIQTGPMGTLVQLKIKDSLEVI